MGHHSTRADGYEDWLKVDRAPTTSVSQTVAKKVANSPHQFSHKSTCEPEAVQAVFQRQGHKVRFWQHQALAEQGQPGVAPSPFHLRGETGEDHIRWRPAS